MLLKYTYIHFLKNKHTYRTGLRSVDPIAVLYKTCDLSVEKKWRPIGSIWFNWLKAVLAYDDNFPTYPV